MGRIICDYYAKGIKQLFGDDPGSEFNQKSRAVNNMYGWLYEKGILEAASFELKETPKGVCFALDTRDLESHREAMKDSGVEGAALAVHHIFDETYTPCLYSGAIQLGWPMRTYRDVDGCVGRSWECDLIKGLNTSTIYDVSKVRDEKGVKEAVKSLFSYYKWPETEKSRVKDWYVEAFPTDELGPLIKEGLRFCDVVKSLNLNVDIYPVLGVDDSIVRERVFAKTAELLGLEYGVIYDKWLDGAKAPDIPMKDTGGKTSLDGQIQSAAARVSGAHSSEVAPEKEPMH